MIIQTKRDLIKLRGALTENQWPAIKSAVSMLLEDYPRGIIIDAGGLTEVTETGARTFLEAGNFIQSRKARVVVACMPEDMLEEIRKIPGVRSQLAVASTVEEARASLEAGGAVQIEGKAGPAILVPLIGAWQRALSFAGAQASARRAEIHLLYIIQVPRNLAIGVPMPEVEHEAQQTLSEAERLLKRSGVRIRKLTSRAREAAEGVVRFAVENKPDLIVVAFHKSEMAMEGKRYSVMGTFCHDSPCDVAVLCVSE